MYLHFLYHFNPLFIHFSKTTNIPLFNISITMFAKLALQVLAVSALATGVFAKPLPVSRALISFRGESHSFNNWGGHASLNNFDNFYGADNYDNSHHNQVIVKQEDHLVCRTQQVEIIQQRLVVLQEMAKKIITEQVCEVETQTIVFEQFHASLGGFSQDLRHKSDHQVGYDRNIVNHYGDFYGSDGSLSTHDFGFKGSDVGSSTVVVGGSNWDDSTSPASVESAFSAAQEAVSNLN